MRGRPLHPGDAAGEIIILSEPLSFWGGFDATSGRIIDRAHPEVGQSLAGKVVAMPGSRGSSGTPGVLGEALRRGTGPAAMLITKADVNLLAGAMVAAALYEAICPVILVDASSFAVLDTGAHAKVAADGTITIA
jgi:predicted aconitase with swiveling domain